MSSRLEPSTHTTGAPRPPRRALRPSPRQPARYEPYLDGLFTYCLAALHDHEAATGILGDVLAIAERQYGRSPDDEAERKAWLYALARWACLRRLTRQRRSGPGAHTGRAPAGKPLGKPVGKPAGRAPGRQDGGAPAGESAGESPGEPAAHPRISRETAERRRAELSLLAWPEAAGTSPEQREALELAVRHGLGTREVAAVLGLEVLAARELLSAAACEVERTRAALAVVEGGGCPAVARLAGDQRVLLSAALRTELVRHVDDCPRCRRAAERAGESGPWPGCALTPATLPLVPAPRAAAHISPRHVPRARGALPRFGPSGFPLDPKDHAARRDRLRARAVTTTVVATVVAAPVLALWAAYRGAPPPGDAGPGGAGVSATRADGGDAMTGEPHDRYENAGSAEAEPGPRFHRGGRSSAVSVEVISTGTPPDRPGRTGPGRLTVEAEPFDGTTLITLRASGGAPVAWSVWTDAPWLAISRVYGMLRPGETVTVQVAVDTRREPPGPWRARVGVDPSGAMVAIEGRGVSRPAAAPSPKPSADGPAASPPTASPAPGTDPSPSVEPSPPPPSPSPTSPPP
ncbi:hypothetical protein [Streptomyces sp. CAU 1734]|uniref:BACON domain-containing protein n=1 Tax=Streptomyces sp. CAU 1734 TaxID=3140360 RepID=UPI0032611437